MLYIAVMKRTLVLFLIAAVFTGLVFANGAPEDQAIFENLLRNQQYQSVQNVSNSGKVSQQPSAAVGAEIISRDMASLERLYQYVNKNFLYDIDYDAVYDAMATALFDALDDKYTYYITSDDSSDYEEQLTGVYGGLGIYFSKTYLEYQNPDDESSRAGFIAGDMITHINGEPVDEMTANECAAKMKGEVGTTVDITIKRKSSSFTLTLTREVITVPTVEYEMVDGSVAYLRILEFSQNTLSAVNEALEDLDSQGMKSLIIDLRDNPGGDVDVTLSIADMFISGKKLLSVSYKDTSRNVVYKSSEGTIVDPSVKVAILINEGTASSAEILSSTMRDNGRAVLIGATTYGKGVMQQISSFGDGYTSITVASFVPPSGDTIQGEGVSPDIEGESLVVQDDEMDAYSELLNGTKIEEFVDSNPDYTAQNVSKFVDEFSYTGIRAEILQVLARNEYYARMTTEERPLADIEYDPTCKAAYEYLLED